MERNLLVTGSTGKTGSQTTELLPERSHRVCAPVRRRDERAARLADRGAEIVEGDVHDIGYLAGATKGIEALCFIHPVPPTPSSCTATTTRSRRSALRPKRP
ncbi:NAD(P)H-binding protein [Streptomyces sp. NPDC094038]|uniref:NAD(P)H-binding protein n=1 Tax=Streptomyces sp. NPDC094038 TaxID=3366055 RepID=UPI00381A9791